MWVLGFEGRLPLRLLVALEAEKGSRVLFAGRVELSYLLSCYINGAFSMKGFWAS